MKEKFVKFKAEAVMVKRAVIYENQGEKHFKVYEGSSIKNDSIKDNITFFACDMPTGTAIYVFEPTIKKIISCIKNGNSKIINRHNKQQKKQNDKSTATIKKAV